MHILLNNFLKKLVLFILILTISFLKFEIVYPSELKKFDEFLNYLEKDLTRNVVNSEKEAVLNSVNKQIGILSKQIFEELQKPKFGLKKLNLAFTEFCDSLNVNGSLKPWHKRRIEKNLKKIKDAINELKADEEVRSFVDDKEEIFNKRKAIVDNVNLFTDDFALFLNSLKVGGFGTKIIDACFHRRAGLISSFALLPGTFIFAGVPYFRNLLKKMEKKNEEKRKEQELKREKKERRHMLAEELAQLKREEGIAKEELDKLKREGRWLQDVIALLEEIKEELDEESKRLEKEEDLSIPNNEADTSSEGDLDDGSDSYTDPWNKFKTNGVVELGSYGSVIINNLSNEVEEPQISINLGTEDVATIAKENGSGIEIKMINEGGIESEEQDGVLSNPENITNNGYISSDEEPNDESSVLNGYYTGSDGDEEIKLWNRRINDLPNEETTRLREKIEQNDKEREEYKRKIQELITKMEKNSEQTDKNRQDREKLLQQLEENQKQREEKIREHKKRERMKQQREIEERIQEEREMKELNRLIEERNRLGAEYDNLVESRLRDRNLRNRENPRSEIIYGIAENIVRQKKPVNYSSIDGVKTAIRILTERIDELRGMPLEEAIEKVINDINAQ